MNLSLFQLRDLQCINFQNKIESLCTNNKHALEIIGGYKRGVVELKGVRGCTDIGVRGVGGKQD